MINWAHFLNKTKIRDSVLFLLVTLLVSTILLESVYAFMPFSFKKLIIGLLFAGQFYVSAFLSLPIKNRILRRISYLLFFVLNYFIFREFVLSFTPRSVFRLFNMEWILVLVFLLTLFSRSVRMYYQLQQQLVLLNNWTQRKILFKKPSEITLNMGREGDLKVHPNELVYIRTKAAGDHTKVFGIKWRQPNGVTPRLSEYETSAYRNFEEVFDLLRSQPQFKRVHQSTVINTIYPYQAKDGVLQIEGRRFSISKDPGRVRV